MCQLIFIVACDWVCCAHNIKRCSVEHSLIDDTLREAINMKPHNDIILVCRHVKPLQQEYESHNKKAPGFDSRELFC